MKKLIFSVIMLLLAVVMVFVSVFAWFSMQNEVGIGSPDIPIAGDHVTSVSVGYYYASENGAGGYRLGAQMAEADQLPIFSTAENRPVIAKIDFVYHADTDFILQTTVSCTCPAFITVDKDDSGRAVVGNAFLSNISEITFLSKTGDDLLAIGDARPFYAAGVKSTYISQDLSFSLTADNAYTVYLMIAYNRYAISRFYFLLLQQGISSNATVYTFKPDLMIGFAQGERT